MSKKAQSATVSNAGAHAIPVSLSAMLVTLGVVYGDIGTSPMYVTKALGCRQRWHYLGKPGIYPGRPFACDLDSHAAYHH